MLSTSKGITKNSKSFNAEVLRREDAEMRVDFKVAGMRQVSAESSRAQHLQFLNYGVG